MPPSAQHLAALYAPLKARSSGAKGIRQQCIFGGTQRDANAPAAETRDTRIEFSRLSVGRDILPRR